MLKEIEYPLDTWEIRYLLDESNEAYLFLYFIGREPTKVEVVEGINQAFVAAGMERVRLEDIDYEDVVQGKLLRCYDLREPKS